MRSAFSVSSSGSPGPAPTRYTMPRARRVSALPAEALRAAGHLVQLLFSALGIHVGREQIAPRFTQLANPLRVFGTELLLELDAKALGQGRTVPAVEIAICKSPRLTTAG